MPNSSHFSGLVISRTDVYLEKFHCVRYSGFPGTDVVAQVGEHMCAVAVVELNDLRQVLFILTNTADNFLQVGDRAVMADTICRPGRSFQR